MKINGKIVKTKRETLGFSRAEIAVAADLTESRIAQIENTDEAEINRNIARAIASKLGCKPEALGMKAI